MTIRPEELKQRLADVDGRIADAARAAGRDPAEVTRIVVTKFHPVELVEALRDLGVRDFGENRHQEAREKAAAVGDVTWHFVGQLQGKKARQVREYAHVIHSVDRSSLVDALASDSHWTRVLLQVNLTDDPGRGGVDPAGLAALADEVVRAPGLDLLGVMAVAPLGEDPRRAYERVHLLSDEVRAIAPEATAISAGMSGDFCEAVENGATHLRIGTAITGERPARG